MSDWDDDDSEDRIYFPPHIPGTPLDYFEWRYHMMSLGFSIQDFEEWWRGCREDEDMDNGLREMWKVIKRNK